MNDSTIPPSAGPDPRVRGTLAEQVDAWERNEVASFIARAPERQERFATLGGFPLKRTYTALDLADTPLEDIGLPGQYPFTRGPYPTMYRGRPWTMRQIAGFGTAEDTNRRFKYLIAQGQTGLSTDFDMPTLMGYDSDHPMSEGEVGREGVAIDTLADMEHLFDGIETLLGEIDRHRRVLEETGEIDARRTAIAERRLLAAGEAILRDEFARHRTGRMSALLEQLRARSVSPHAAARQLLRELQLGGDA